MINPQTPITLPWFRTAVFIAGQPIDLKDRHGNTITRFDCGDHEQDQFNSRFVIRACNAYEVLMAALRKADAALSLAARSSDTAIRNAADSALAAVDKAIVDS